MTIQEESTILNEEGSLKKGGNDEETATLLAWKQKRLERQNRRRTNTTTTTTTTTNNNNNNNNNSRPDDEQEPTLLSFEESMNQTTNENHHHNNDTTTTTTTTTTYIPLSKRRRMEAEEILQKDTLVHRRRRLLQLQQQQEQPQPTTTTFLSSKDGYGSTCKQTTTATTTAAAAATQLETTQWDSDNNHDKNLQESTTTITRDEIVPQEKVESLLNSAAALHKKFTEAERAEQQRKEEEARILREASKVQHNALQAASERAHGVTYTESLPSTWKPPTFILQQGTTVWDKIRSEWHIDVEGTDIPPPIKRFQDMKFPKPILEALQEKGIKRPTPIQMQGLTVSLAGRDMIGIAFTGSGKTLTFSLPLVMAALEEELRMPLVAGEGPVGIILAPSRELARQTFDVVQEFCTKLSSSPQYPQLRCQLLIGGESVRDQVSTLQSSGIHCVVATPGRLRDVLKRKTMSLAICRYICLDEADRMLDLGFDEEVGEIMNYFPHQRQTLLFSATFPKKFQDFARETLVKPIIVNVGRAGAANLDVIQEVEYVKQEAKIVYLLHCLQKTAPPVIIFCERKGDVDDIHEYLLLKGVEAVSIHGGKVCTTCRTCVSCMPCHAWGFFSFSLGSVSHSLTKHIYPCRIKKNEMRPFDCTRMGRRMSWLLPISPPRDWTSLTSNMSSILICPMRLKIMFIGLAVPVVVVRRASQRPLSIKVVRKRRYWI